MIFNQQDKYNVFLIGVYFFYYHINLTMLRYRQIELCYILL